jgi:hypothetical protein
MNQLPSLTIPIPGQRLAAVNHLHLLFTNIGCQDMTAEGASKSFR